VIVDRAVAAYDKAGCETAEGQRADESGKAAHRRRGG
jgi:hypothetical protein